MRRLAKSVTVLITMGLTVLVGGTAYAAPTESTGSLLSNAGVTRPADKALAVNTNTVNVDGLTVQIHGVGASRIDQKRHIWKTHGIDHVAQRTEHGAQLLSVLTSKDSPRRVSYTFPGQDLQALPDGSVAVVNPAGRGNLVARIEKPWAKDATGATVSTRYEVNGDVLTQVVTPTATTQFPVVADPSVVSKWYGKQVRFSRTETRNISYGATACTIVTGTIPDVTISKIAAAACAALALGAQIALDQGNCLAVNVFYTGNVTPWYWNC